MLPAATAVGTQAGDREPPEAHPLAFAVANVLGAEMGHDGFSRGML